jgi:phosphopantothenoylcysteine decarboxylase/phosphopantothenate--cysteine ligase
VRGEVASGDEGMGRMAEPSAIAAVAAGLLRSPGAQDLAGVRVVVTAGPTLEDLDPVRFLGNRSSGKMGFAIAARAAARGAEVTLVAGPVSLGTPTGVRRIDVRGALEMRAALSSLLLPDLSGADVLIMAAAVADHRPVAVAATKIKKNDAKAVIELVKNPDLIGEIGAARAARAAPANGATKLRPVLVGFAVETAGGRPDAQGALVAYARRKLEEKRVDLVVCNDAAESFGQDDNTIALVGRGARGAKGAETNGEGDSAAFLPRASKSVLADAILSEVRALL